MPLLNLFYVVSITDAQMITDAQVETQLLNGNILKDYSYQVKYYNTFYYLCKY